MVRKKLTFDDDDVHPAWNDDVEDVATGGGLRFAKSFNDWVIKLSFLAGKERMYGSAFFVNFPGISHYVIFTAAHNFIQAGQPTTMVKILLAGGKEIPLVPHQIKICPQYLVDPKPSNDFAVVLVPRPQESFELGDDGVPPEYYTKVHNITRITSSSGINGKPRGFAYGIKLGYEEFFNSEVHVTGYRVGSEAGKPITSSGACRFCLEETVEYMVPTEKGISGSPVWVEYMGNRTVIGIHNNGPKNARGGSRAARIGASFLKQVFEWIPVVAEYNVRLRAQAAGKKKAALLPSTGLFLNFTQDFEFGRTRLGNGSIFAVFPALVSSEDDEETQKFALQLSATGQWVVFNPMQNKVTLSATLRDGCMFSKMNKKKSPMGTVITRIVIEARNEYVGNEDKRFQLRMQSTRLSENDASRVESSEVDLIKYPSEDLFTHFSFE